MIYSKAGGQEQSGETPTNLGFPLNTTDDDKFFQPVNNGRNGYYSMTTGYKKEDIFYIEFGSNEIDKLFEIKGKVSLKDTSMVFDENYAIHLVNKVTGDTLDVGHPNKFTGLYSFAVAPGKFKLFYKRYGFITQTVDTSILPDNLKKIINIDITLQRDTSIKDISMKPTVYAKIDLTQIPSVSTVDTSILVRNLNVSDVGDINIKDSDVLYYTVQVMALHNPVDMSYFKYINDLKVLYNDADKFYRTTAGKFKTREEASSRRLELLKKVILKIYLLRKYQNNEKLYQEVSYSVCCVSLLL